MLSACGKLELLRLSSFKNTPYWQRKFSPHSRSNAVLLVSNDASLSTPSWCSSRGQAARAIVGEFLSKRIIASAAQGAKTFVSAQKAVMGTRTSFRPRPLDTARQLNIVRDVKELDDGEQKVSRDIVHSHEALDKDNEEVYDTRYEEKHMSLIVLHICISCSRVFACSAVIKRRCAQFRLAA